MNNKNGLSFLVFCYNSEDIIENTLSRICKQHFNHDAEIILIDNNSKDQTFATAESYLKQNSIFPYKIILEKRQGLNYARETAIMAARFPFCIMVDDDNLLIGTNWIQKIVRIFEDHPKVGIIGCGSIADTGNARLPAWWGRDFKFGDGEQKNVEGVFDPKKPSDMMWGACLALRTPIAQKCQTDLPMLLTDRAGTASISSGGDIELECRISLKGFKSYYSKELKFRHLIDHSRLSDGYLIKLFYGHKTIYPVHIAYQELLLGNRVRPIFVLLKGYAYCSIHFVRSLYSYLFPKKSNNYYKSYVNRININCLIGQYKLFKKVRMYKTELNQLGQAGKE